MDHALALDIFRIEVWHMIALIFSITINGILFRRAEKSSLRDRYLLVQVCLLIWIASKILKTISPTVDWRWFFIVTQYLGVSFLGSTFFLFAFRFVRRRDPHPVLTVLLLVGSLSCFILVATNPAHHLFYGSYDFYRDTFGPLFYLTMVFQYLQILAALILLMSRIIMNQSFAAQDRLIGIAALLPLVVNILYIARIIRPPFDITPIAMTMVLLLFAVAAFRFKFLGVLPLAHHMIRVGLKDPVLVFDPGGKLIDSRRVSEVLRTTGGHFDIPVGGVLSSGNRFFRQEGLRQVRGWRLEHWVDISQLRRLEQEKAQAVKCRESLEDEILRRNAALLRTAEAEAVRHTRMDLHDVLGHSLTQVMILLRTVHIPDGRISLSARDTLLKARNVCSDSINRASGIEVIPDSGNDLLSSDLYQLAEVFIGSPVDFQILIRGSERRLQAEIHQVLLRCCQEAVTNAVKHGHPEEIILVLRFRRGGLLLVIVDDGAGCEKVVPGFGLTGMAERVGKIGGSLRYQSEHGGGMQISLWIPDGVESSLLLSDSGGIELR